MPTRLVHLVFDANDPPKLARFWAAALGWEVAAEEPDEVVVWPSGYDYPDPAALALVFVPVPEAKTVKNRVHLDLATESAGQQATVVDRLRGLGARPLDIGQGDVPWVVLGDPEGNELCVLEPRPVYADTGPVAAVRVLREAAAVPVDIGQGDVSWTVQADPQGNEFCVLSPR